MTQPKAPRLAQRLIDEVFDALDEQTVMVPGTGTLDLVTPSPARSLAAVHERRRALEAQTGQLLEAHPPSAVLTPIPGVAVRTAATLLVTIGDGTSFPTAALLRLDRRRINVLSATLRDGTFCEPGNPRLA